MFSSLKKKCQAIGIHGVAALTLIIGQVLFGVEAVGTIYFTTSFGLQFDSMSVVVGMQTKEVTFSRNFEEAHISYQSFCINLSKTY